VVGYDYSNNEVIIKDSSGNDIRAPYEKVGVKLSQKAIVTRSRSGNGNRSVRAIITPNNNGLVSSTVEANGSSVPNETDVCESSTRGSNGPRPEPEEPLEPEDPEVPPPPQEAPEREEKEPPSKPEGCEPTSNQQWYNSADGQSGCPTGTDYLGFAQLPDGSFMVLCEGSDRPPGDGCPTVPDEYGWECVRSTGTEGLSETCQEVPNGLYATKAECESICLCSDCEEGEEDPQESVAYNFTPGDPVNGVPGSCSFELNGTYATEDACKADNGLVDGQRYVVTYIFDRFPIYQTLTRVIFGPVNVTGWVVLVL
jgi:hypothetical protein